jgi:flagellar hook protein FlgE
MSFQQGLSGLNGASKTLETIGNNIANANTAGFKASQVQFADVFANSLTGSGGAGSTGIGVKVAQIAQQFSQGNITASASPLDMAINGGGFFRMDNNGSITFARNGQFQLDKSGFIVNSVGSKLTGFTVNAAGQLSTGNPGAIQINNADLPPKRSTAVTSQLNLDSRVANVTAAFNMTDPTTYHNATSVSVFDSLGNSHIMQTFYVKTAANSWSVYAANDGAPITGGQAGGAVGLLTFNGATGAIATATPALPFPIALPTTTGALPTPYTVTLDLAGTTQFGSTFSVNALSQDGYASGRLAGFNTGSDGIITGRYTNGKSAVLGQVVLANFTNPNGLQPLGNNTWAESANSGQALVGVPNSGGLGVVQSNAVEDSNVDLTAELVTMITAQRVYQANAQTIKTQDQVLQTLVNLR